MNSPVLGTGIGLALLLAAQASLAEPASLPAATDRPHIVVFISDDHTWNDCGPYGAKDVRTPQLDRLAEEAMRFDLAFAASPTCAPSRAAIYTGLLPFRNGAHANHSLVRDGLRTLPHYLGELGYRVVLAGKSHIGPRTDSVPAPLMPIPAQTKVCGSSILPV